MKIAKEFHTYLYLSLIVILALFLRFYQLSEVPPSLTWDEVAWGYNAYSIGIDGRDEFGKLFPITFIESFGDFKPPVYAYLTVIPVWLFGINEFSTRFASAFFGSLTVLISYFLVLRIFPKSENKVSYALFSTFFLAISPWHINLSRAAFEANVSSFFIISGIWFFLAGIQNKKWFLVLSAISFVISMYTFNTARVVSPLLVAVFLVAFFPVLKKNLVPVIVSIVLGFVMLAPLIPFLLSPQASLRFKEVNIFNDSQVVKQANQEIENDNKAWWSNIVHNRRVGYTLSYFKHYFDNFSPSFLFITGDGNPKFSTQDVGQLYLWELPFFVLGGFLLFRHRSGYWWIIPVWIIIGIIPAATARETPHALRIETIIPSFHILISIGVVAFLQFVLGIKSHLLNNNIKRSIVVICFALLGINVFYYLHGYYIHYARLYSGEWQYGYKDAISYISGVEDQYDRIYFTEGLGRPYIYFLFYKQYDPDMFRASSTVERETLGFVHVSNFDKYFFFKQMPVDSAQKILYFQTPDDVPPNAIVEEKFYLKNGEVSLVAYTL